MTQKVSTWYSVLLKQCPSLPHVYTCPQLNFGSDSVWTVTKLGWRQWIQSQIQHLSDSIPNVLLVSSRLLQSLRIPRSFQNTRDWSKVNEVQYFNEGILPTSPSRFLRITTNLNSLARLIFDRFRNKVLWESSWRLSWTQGWRWCRWLGWGRSWCSPARRRRRRASCPGCRPGSLAAGSGCKLRWRCWSWRKAPSKPRSRLEHTANG